MKEEDRIRLVFTDDKYTSLKPGDEGVVDWLGEPGKMRQIGVAWDNGNTLMLIEGVDKYEII